MERQTRAQRVSNLAKVTQTIRFNSWDSSSGVLGSGPELVTSEPSCLVREEGNGEGGSPLGLG